MYQWHLIVKHREQQQAGSFHQTVSAIMSCWDDEVRQGALAGTPLDNNTVNVVEDKAQYLFL